MRYCDFQDRISDDCKKYVKVIINQLRRLEIEQRRFCCLSAYLFGRNENLSVLYVSDVHSEAFAIVITMETRVLICRACEEIHTAGGTFPYFNAGSGCSKLGF